MRNKIFITAMVVSTLVLSGCLEDPCGTEVKAEYFAKGIVKKRLRDPDSAKFGEVRVKRDHADACRYEVAGSFSAKNGFGGMTPGAFYMKMIKVKGEFDWSATDIEIQ